MENSSKLLKVIGILKIVFGSIFILVSLIGMLGVAVIAEVIDEMANDLAALGIDPGLFSNTGYLMTSLLILLVIAVLMLIAGIVGVKSYTKPEKANVCIVFGVLVALGVVFSSVHDVISAGFGATTVVNIVIVLVLPVLYLLGAFKLKKLAGLQGEVSEY